jgi:hypothetical protein
MVFRNGKYFQKSHTYKMSKSSSKKHKLPFDKIRWEILMEERLVTTLVRFHVFYNFLQSLEKDHATRTYLFCLPFNRDKKYVGKKQRVLINAEQKKRLRVLCLLEKLIDNETIFFRMVNASPPGYTKPAAKSHEKERSELLFLRGRLKTLVKVNESGFVLEYREMRDFFSLYLAFIKKASFDLHFRGGKDSLLSPRLALLQIFVNWGDFCPF